MYKLARKSNKNVIENTHFQLKQRHFSSGAFTCMLLLLDNGGGGGDDLRTTGEMRWGEGWDEDDVDPLKAQEEVANNEN